jgi:hypothetical protein
MPRLTCPCGESIDLSPLPNPLGFKLLAEPVLEEVLEALGEAAAADPAAFERAAYALFFRRERPLPHAYECPACGRVAVFARASDAVPAAWYRPEPAGGDAGPPARLAALAGTLPPAPR